MEPLITIYSQYRHLDICSFLTFVDPFPKRSAVRLALGSLLSLSYNPFAEIREC